MQAKRNTKKKAMLGLALFMASAIAAGVALGLPQTGTADAARDAGAWTTVNEIYNDDTQSFDGANMMELIKALTGERSYDALERAAEATTTSDGFRTANGGKNVSVYFGGMKWDAVYLTEAKTTSGDTEEGDIILDLWRSADTLIASTQQVVYDTAVYSYYWADKSPAKSYPSNMYSTSFIRVKALNAGGQYSGSGGESLTSSAQDENNQYARFTMDGVEGSLTEYIAKPSEVGYQATEYDAETMRAFYGDGTKYYFPNDAYGEPSDGEWYKDSGSIDMSRYSSKGEGATAYNAWKDDYLWLPSLTETGIPNRTVKEPWGTATETTIVADGMWDTDAPLRSAKSGVGQGYCWLRSGAAYRADQAYLLTDSGSYNQLVVSNGMANDRSCGVRPALHLNLTAAAHTAILDRENWNDETKTYSPNGVTWEIVNTDMVEITPVEEGGDTSWYKTGEHTTITADKVGEYKLNIKPSDGFQWKDGTSDAITVTYKVVPADMTVTFNNGASGVFNNGRLEKRREVVYSLGMEPIVLKLPDPTASNFPITWKDVSWFSDAKDKIKIQYIVTKRENYDKAEIEAYLDDHLKLGEYAEEWKDYDNLTDKTAQELMYYVVYFKAVDTEGNHNPCYDYFVVHIATEDLKITLTEAAIKGFAKGVEYGDVAHTKNAFEEDILGGIEKVTATAADPEGADIDKTKEFKDNLDSFTFYLRKDNSMQGDTVQDDGDIYTVEDGGIYLQKDGSEKVDNLPLGTYHLYVAVEDENASKYLTLAWSGDRPSFTVSARKINVTLTFEKGATYGDAHTGWVTATASRATAGAEGSWYAPNEAEREDDFRILGLSYTLQGTGTLQGTSAPSNTTPADTYTVTPTRTNTNYEVHFADEHGGTTFEYTIGKATLTVTAQDNAITYGDEPSDGGVTYSGFVNGEEEGVLSGVLMFDYDGYVTYDDVGEYVITPSGLSSNNYDFDYKEGTLTVHAKEIKVKWSEKSYIYTGEEFTELPTATADGIGKDGTFTLLVALSDSAQTFKNAGGYAFKAALDIEDAKTKNYTLNENTKTRAYIVEKQTVTVPTVASKVYNGETQKADVGASLLFTETENNGGINAGDYDVKLTLQHPENYKWATGDEAEIILIFTITKADYDMSDVTFEDVIVDYDGQAHSITIAGTLPNGVTVAYEGNGMKAVGKYTVTATFKGDAQNYNPIDPMTATLTILSVGNLVTRLEYTSPGSKLPNVIVDSAKGFDSTMELAIEEAYNIARTFLAWEKDEISDKYTVKLMKDGEEISLDGKVTVRLLIPEEFRDKDFTFQRVGESAAVEYTREDDYVVFEADGLSAYTFAMDGTAYLPSLLVATLVLLLSVGTQIVLAIVIKKNKKGE